MHTHSHTNTHTNSLAEVATAPISTEGTAKTRAPNAPTTDSTTAWEEVYTDNTRWK